MLTKTLKNILFDGTEVEEVHYFNLTPIELIELETYYGDQGLSGFVEYISQTKDNRKILEAFKHIVLSSYGERSADGKRFIKSEEIRNSFQSTEAYSNLVLEFLENPETLLVEFFTKLSASANRKVGEVDARMTPSQQARKASESNLQGFKPKQESPTPAFQEAAPIVQDEIDPVEAEIQRRVEARLASQRDAVVPHE